MKISHETLPCELGLLLRSGMSYQAVLSYMGVPRHSSLSLAPACFADSKEYPKLSLVYIQSQAWVWEHLQLTYFSFHIFIIRPTFNHKLQLDYTPTCSCEFHLQSLSPLLPTYNIDTVNNNYHLLHGTRNSFSPIRDLLKHWLLDQATSAREKSHLGRRYDNLFFTWVVYNSDPVLVLQGQGTDELDPTGGLEYIYHLLHSRSRLQSRAVQNSARCIPSLLYTHTKSREQCQTLLIGLCFGSLLSVFEFLCMCICSLLVWALLLPFPCDVPSHCLYLMFVSYLYLDFPLHPPQFFYTSSSLHIITIFQPLYPRICYRSTSSKHSVSTSSSVLLASSAASDGI